MRGHLLQVMDAEHNPFILNTHTHPDILRPWQILGDFQETCTPFCKDLENVLRSLSHRVKHLLDEGEWHLFLEQITHGIDKHETRMHPF